MPANSPTQRGLLRACAIGLVTGACVVGGLWRALGPKAPPGPNAPPQTEAGNLDQFAAYGDYPDHFDHAWVTSADSFGCGGVALAIRGDEYFYWQYSNCPSFDWGPYRGAFELCGNVLILKPPRMDVPDDAREGTASEPHLTSKVWSIQREPLGVRLYAVGGEIERNRGPLLVDTQFNPKHPFRNQDRLEVGPVAELKPPLPFQPKQLPDTAREGASLEPPDPPEGGFCYPFPMKSGTPRAGTAGIPDFSLNADADPNNEFRPPDKAAEESATSPAAEPEATPVPHH